MSMHLQEEPVFTELKRNNEEEKIVFNLDVASAGPSKTRYHQSKSVVKCYSCSLGKVIKQDLIIMSFTCLF